ncbi:unnamed protein product [Echinostoma caproni]|uniref:Uncharacterized protein n=1 Tax=Echinostoma caproni TaxID=27848 RepID=A0A3P8L3F8_9TREM|nr:unnamed protein product [Echinostoma caproni]
MIGHAAGHGTEAFLGTGNDFAATVNSQSLTNTTQRLLDRRYASQTSVVSDHPDNSISISTTPTTRSDSASRLRNRVSLSNAPLPSMPPTPGQMNVCTRPMASVGSPSVIDATKTPNETQNISSSPPLSNSSKESFFDAV